MSNEQMYKSARTTPGVQWVPGNAQQCLLPLFLRWGAPLTTPEHEHCGEAQALSLRNKGTSHL